MVASQIDKRCSTAASLECGVVTLGSDMNLRVDDRSFRSTFECTQYGHFHRFHALISGEQLSHIRMAERFLSKRSFLVRCSARRMSTGKGVK